MTAPAFSVILATVHRPELAVAAVRSVLGGTWADLEILVVDQSRDVRTREAVTALGDPRVVYLHSDVTGLSRARNLGAAHARGSLLAFLDDDAVADPAWLTAYSAAFATLPRPGMVGGRLRPLWDAPRPAWFPAAHAFLLGLYDLGDARCEFPPRDLPIGANFAIPADVLRRVGGFEVTLGFDASRSGSLVAGEDTALGLRVRRAGLRVLYEPGAAALHHVSSAKLTPRYYLSRLYWAGRSHVRTSRLVGSPGVLASDAPHTPNRALPAGGPAQRIAQVAGRAAVLAGAAVELLSSRERSAGGAPG
ncbi:glycosyltransferase family 2 protein [Anaeromyxobacter sp. Red801]|uniref:glycosyltransferase family 2 protein n=1 Tax=Anaeromyxobacter sp. Red801 TaxID=3411632 RepID=UPI003BA08385